jgi:hypothetical protein
MLLKFACLCELKMAEFWVVALRSLVEFYGLLVVLAASAFETSVNYYQTS